MNGESLEVPQPEDIEGQTEQGGFEKDSKEASAEKRPETTDREKIDKKNRSLIKKVGDELKERLPALVAKSKEEASKAVEKGKEKASKFLTRSRREGAKRMRKVDELANIDRYIAERLEEGQVGLVLEVLFGAPRTEVSERPAENVIVMTDNMEQAKDFHKTFGENQQVVVASPHALPFREGVFDRVVDPHKLTHVGPKDKESLGGWRQSLGNLFSEAKAYFRQKKGDLQYLAARPTYVTEGTHESWKATFGESLKERAAVLSKNGKLIFSVGVTPPEWGTESGYMAHTAQVGEVFLKPDEIKELMTEAGLEVDEAYAGMGPRTQFIHAENAAKAVIMSVAGWERERFFDEVLIPIAHSIVNRLGTGKRESLEGLSPEDMFKKLKIEKVDLDRFEEARTSGLASARTPEGKPLPPDRVIVVASKEGGE